MPEVMRERKRLCVLLIQVERRTYGSCNLGDLNRVGQPVPKVVAQTRGEDLRLALQPAERARMDDTIAIPLEIIAERMLRLGILPATKICRTQTKSAEH
jgi:hypothetical protein